MTEIKRTLKTPAQPQTPTVTDTGTDREPKLLIARDGDVLTVTYGECTIPIKQYANVKVGGYTYTRVLRSGDVVEEQHRAIYKFLELQAEAEAVTKVKKWAEEMNGGR